VVRLTAACDPSGAVEGPSATTGVRHSQRTESGAGGGFSATWYDQFPGGCVTSRLHLTTDPNGEFAAQAPQVLGFTTRAALQQALASAPTGDCSWTPGRHDEPARHGEVMAPGHRRAAVMVDQQPPAARRSRTRLVVQVPQLGDAQLHVAGLGGQQPGAGAGAVGRAAGRAFVAVSTDVLGGVGLDQRPDGLGVLVGASQRLRRLADMHRSTERLASGSLLEPAVRRTPRAERPAPS
jgi:hypothetical protein